MEAKNANELVITRTINGPRDLIFKAFTEAKHLKHWWGPVGFELSVIKLDVKPGGVFHYSMKNAEGVEMFGIFHYKKINAPESIEFTNGFADKDGNLINNAFLPVFPLEIYNTWTFTEENGKTTLTLKGVPYNASVEEEKAFKDMHSGMNQGFGGTFDQLENYLKSL